MRPTRLPWLLAALSLAACQPLLSRRMVEPAASQADSIRQKYAELARQAGVSAPRFALGVPTRREAAFVLFPQDDGSPSAARVACRAGGPGGAGELRPVETRFGSSRRVALRDFEGTADCQVDDPRGGFHVPLTLGPDETPDEFSFVTHSCNSPFVTHDGKDEVVALSSDTRTVYELMKARGEGKLRLAGLPPRPSFGLGMGDQLYLDPDNTDHPQLSLLSGPRSNRLRVAADEVPAMMRLVYRATFGLPGLREAYERIPHALVWDDHDIGDGWGSQGHEPSSSGRRYMAAARAAFLEYQGSRNPTLGGQPLRPAWVDEITQSPELPLDVGFRWGSEIAVSLIDDRTERVSAALDPDRRRIVRPGQLRRIGAQLARLPAGKPGTLILGLPLPLVFMVSQKTLALTTANVSARAAEQLDDMRDGWGENPRDLEALMTVLLPHFEREPRHRLLIVSGDVHRSGVYRLSFTRGDGPPRVLGYEVVSSGLAEYIGPETACLVESVLHTRDRLTLAQNAAMHRPSDLHLDFAPLGYLDGAPLFTEVGVRRDPRWGHTFRVAFLTGRHGYPDEACLDSPPRLPPELNAELAAQLAQGATVDLTEGASIDLDAMPPSKRIPCRQGKSIAVKAVDALLPDGACYQANLFDKIVLDQHRAR